MPSGRSGPVEAPGQAGGLDLGELCLEPRPVVGLGDGRPQRLDLADQQFFRLGPREIGIGEALRPEFKIYARNVIDNARALADSLQVAGFKIVSNGTDSHLMLVDLTPKGVTGADAETALERAGITTNKNGIPFDPLPPVQTSGLPVPAGFPRIQPERAKYTYWLYFLYNTLFPCVK